MAYLRSEEKFRKYETEGFRSESGKIDFYLPKYEYWGYDLLPDFV